MIGFDADLPVCNKDASMCWKTSESAAVVENTLSARQPESYIVLIKRTRNNVSSAVQTGKF